MLDFADQSHKIEVVSPCPGLLEQRRDQHGLAPFDRVGLDTDQVEQSADDGADVLADRLGAFKDLRRRSCRGPAQGW
jgi:hypothetical protein